MPFISLKVSGLAAIFFDRKRYPDDPSGTRLNTSFDRAMIGFLDDLEKCHTLTIKVDGKDFQPTPRSEGRLELHAGGIRTRPDFAEVVDLENDWHAGDRLQVENPAETPNFKFRFHLNAGEAFVSDHSWKGEPISFVPYKAGSNRGHDLPALPSRRIAEEVTFAIPTPENDTVLSLCGVEIPLAGGKDHCLEIRNDCGDLNRKNEDYAPYYSTGFISGSYRVRPIPPTPVPSVPHMLGRICGIGYFGQTTI